MALLSLKGASAAYNGVRVVRDITLEVAAGEKVSLIGASGAGKSTLLGMLYRQQPERIALVPQDPALVRSLSVFHNAYIGGLERHPAWYNLLNLAWPLPREVRDVRTVLESLGLEDKLWAPAGELSGGQQQRTAVARALFRRVDTLLADEPVSAVDPAQADTVLRLLVESHETVVLAMHDVSLALRHTHRLIGLRDGRIAMDRPSAGLDPADLVAFYEG